MQKCRDIFSFAAVVLAVTGITEAKAFPLIGTGSSGLGVYMTQPTNSGELGPSGKAQLRFENGYGIDISHDTATFGPLLVLHTQSNISLRTGVAEFYQAQSVPVASGSDVHFNAMSLEFALGPRLKPLPYAPFGPIIGTGVGFGLNRINYDDANMQAKVGSQSFSTINVGAFYTVYGEIGAELRLASFGLDFIYRRKYTRSWNSETLYNQVSSFFDDEAVVHAIMSF